MALKLVNKMIHSDRRVVGLSQVRGHPPPPQKILNLGLCFGENDLCGWKPNLQGNTYNKYEIHNPFINLLPVNMQ